MPNEPAATMTERGWPRPHIGGWPVPWVSPAEDLSTFDLDRLAEVRDKLLCQVCGEGHGPDDTTYLLVKDDDAPDVDISGKIAVTINDAVMHERCLRLAAGRCPQLGRLRATGKLRVIACPISAVAVYDIDDEEDPRLAADGADCTVLDAETFLTNTPEP